MAPIISCKNLVKIYKVSGLEVVALQGLDLEIERGEMMGIIGTSGSGKSTLLNILGGLDRPSAGRIMVNGRDLLKASDSILDSYRRTEVGFVWQQTGRNLIPYLTAQANVELPMTILGLGWRTKRKWAQELLEMVGLWEHRQHKLAQLSGGQQQRVAIAVALANKPQLLLGDEPTGEVDSGTAQEIFALFRRMNEELGLTTIIVTHDPQVTRVVDRVITIRDGRTSSETVRRVADVEAALTQGIAETAGSEPAEGAVSSHVFEEYVVVDAAGRLQIPPELREEMNIHHRVTLEKMDGGILIQPVASGQTDLPPSITSDDQTLEDQPPASRSNSIRRWFTRKK